MNPRELPLKVFKKYEHHGVEVSVMAELEGHHRDFCLCYSCEHFKPDQEDNCPIAQRVYELDVELDLVTPVWECPKFEVAKESDPVRLALLRFISFVPETVRPQDYAEVMGWNKDDFEDSDGANLLSETFTYAMLGKMDARTLRALFREICDSLGYDFWKLEIAAHQQKDKLWDY
jgi:hypothetical protein